MKILVTGGAGFIGSNFIIYWMNEHPEDQIVNLDKLTYAGNLENLRSVQDNSNYSFIKGDICDSDLVDKALDGVDKVVHFAAESHVDRSIMDPSQFVKTNVLGTQVLLDSALKHNVKLFHHVSTDEVFGSLSLDSSEKFTEKTKYDPRSPYSASKAGSDHLVNSYYSTYGLPITITNCSNNYGPYQFPEKFIPLAITNLIQDKKIPIYGDGKNVRDWLYVEDHARAIDKVINNGEIGKTYLVGGMDEDVSNVEVAKKIINILGKSEDMIDFIKDRPGHDRKYSVDYSMIERELNWKPLHKFDEWLEKTINWYRDNQEWWNHILTGSYKNYYKSQYGE